MPMPVEPLSIIEKMSKLSVLSIVGFYEKKNLLTRDASLSIGARASPCRRQSSSFRSGAADSHTQGGKKEGNQGHHKGRRTFCIRNA